MTAPMAAAAPAQGAILAIDDSPTARLKLAAAARCAGRPVIVASDAAEGLAALDRHAVDLVLLDIETPGMDGFEALRRLKAAPATRDVPVLVISGLGGDVEGVAWAIALGADDFLPKDFHPALFRARVSVCLERKRLRDAERGYLADFGRIARAAAEIELGRFHARRSGLGAVAGRDDALGGFARVFAAMADEIETRERRLRRAVRTAHGALLLIGCGAAWGLALPLSKVAANVESNPIGLGLAVSMITAVIFLATSVVRGTFPDPRRIDRVDWIRVACLGLVSVLGVRVVTYLLTSNIPASTVAIAVLLEGMFVYAIAAMLRIEPASPRRLAGVVLGLAGVGVVFTGGGATALDPRWFLLAAALPLIDAADDIYLAVRQPRAVDPIAAYALAELMMLPVFAALAFAFDDFLPREALTGPMLGTIVLIGLCLAVAMMLFLELTTTTGPVFASQNGNVVAAAGIAWSVILLGETIPLWSWAGLALIVLGLALVEPKREAEDRPSPVGGASDAQESRP